MKANAALERFEKAFQKSFGEGTLRRDVPIVPYEVISTGSLIFDLALGVGGLVKGRLHEWWGIDAVGKTTQALLTMAEAQRQYPDQMVGIIDVERTFDPKWAAALGVDLAGLYHYEPRTAEDVSDAMRRMISEDLFSIIVLDSVAAMIPRKEMEKMAEEEVVGNQAKIVTRMVKANTVTAAEHGVAVLMLNQVRANIGAYGADKTTGGGWALKHGTTTKAQFKRTGTPPYKVKVNGSEEVVGHELAVLIERNKVSPSKRTAIFSVFVQPSDRYGPVGIDKADEAARIGVSDGQIKHAGAWYTTPDGEKHNGLDRVVEHLRADPVMVSQIRQTALERLAGQVVMDDLTDADQAGEDIEDDD